MGMVWQQRAVWYEAAEESSGQAQERQAASKVFQQDGDVNRLVLLWLLAGEETGVGGCRVGWQ